MHRPNSGANTNEKAKDFKKTILALAKYMAKYKVALVIIVILSIAGSAFNIIGPKIMGNAITEIFNGVMGSITGEGEMNLQAIGQTLLILLGLYLLSSMFTFLQGYVMTEIAQKVSYTLRKNISEKISRLPMKYFDTKTHGEILSRITNDIDTLSQNLNQSLTQIISSIALIIGVIIMMFSISWIMTLIALVILPLSAILLAIVVKSSQKFFKSQQEYLGHVNGQVEEIYGGHNIIKAFNREHSSIEEFNRYNDELYKSAWKSQFFSGVMMPATNFIGNIGYVLVAIVGGWLVINGSIQLGYISSFFQYIRSFTQPIAQVAQVSNMMQSTAAAAERVFEFLDEEEEEQEPKDNVEIDLNAIAGHVQFEDVSFGYSEDKIIINNFSSNIKTGQKIAIVGPTGAGKTTIVKLLMRFYDVNNGAIKIDEHNIKDFNRNKLRELFGMVLQETWLFNGSIMENIRYGKLDATDEEVIAAAKAAHAHHFIKTLPGGYDMIINEEVNNISQGQKQLLTIARTILADNKILILDEATSSVDTRTELRIQKAMDNLMEGRTSFIIAHRLSTIKDADLILAMKDGDIVEQGTHEELIAKNGFYANLYNSQFEQAS